MEHPKFFLVSFKEDDPINIGLIFDESSIFVFERNFTVYGIGKLDQANYVCEISAKEFADSYIAQMFSNLWQKDCTITNKIFGILIDDDRMLVAKKEMKEVVLKALSEQYALDEKYF